MRRFISSILLTLLLYSSFLYLLQSFTGYAHAANTYEVTFTGATFVPQIVTINPGDTVRWTNNSATYVQINSDPHPIHTDYPPLNLGLVAPSQVVFLTFSTIGTYGYHNHLSSNMTGTVIVVSPNPSPTPAPSPSFTVNDLKTLLLDYLSSLDSNYRPQDGKVNSLDAAFVIKWLE